MKPRNFGVSPTRAQATQLTSKGLGIQKVDAPWSTLIETFKITIFGI